ncbi:MAG: homogentisate 1,2-dioxygenase, partial [Bacteroidetes bacterium]
MPHYHKQGKIPTKRHIVFKKPDGGLYAEQVVSTEGFSDLYSVVYHLTPPTQVLKIDEPYSVAPEIFNDKNMQNRSFKGFNVE